MISRVQEYLEKAENSVNNKSYDAFLLSIGSAEACADDADTLSEILYLKAKGLFAFRNFGSAGNAIDEALMMTKDSKKAFKLHKAKALIVAYKGHFRESLRLFKELLAHTEDSLLLAEVYINITWVMLEECKREPEGVVLDEIKRYLDIACKIVEDSDNLQKKRLIFNNYAEYFKLKKDYAMAIEMLERVIPLCAESHLCEIYHSLAQLHLEVGNDELMDKYIHDAEILASRFDNDLVVAKVLYTSAIAKMKKGDYIPIMDSLCIAFYNFLNCGAYNYAYDCFAKLNEASEALKHDCAMALKEYSRSMFSNTAYTDLI